MNILIAGASGLVGTALTQHLQTQGHRVYPLLRHKKQSGSSYWNPEKEEIHLDENTAFDAVINLAGENIANSRWTKKQKAKIYNSRVKSTQLLSQAIAGLAKKPEVFISGSAIGFYGETTHTFVTEQSPKGKGFLSNLARDWEGATQAAEAANIRTIHCRTGVVLSSHGGVLGKMLLPFKLGLGGIIGDGQQLVSWISIHDMVGIIATMLTNKKMTGAYNLVTEKPITNQQFTKALGQVVRRYRQLI